MFAGDRGGLWEDGSVGRSVGRGRVGDAVSGSPGMRGSDGVQSDLEGLEGHGRSRAWPDMNGGGAGEGGVTTRCGQGAAAAATAAGWCTDPWWTGRVTAGGKSYQAYRVRDSEEWRIMESRRGCLDWSQTQSRSQEPGRSRSRARKRSRRDDTATPLTRN